MMKLLRKGLSIGLLSTLLFCGACGSKTDVKTSDKDTPVDAVTTQPTKKDLTSAKKRPPKTPVIPEARIKAVTGTVEYKKASREWAPLDSNVTLDINDGIRVGKDGAVTFLLPNESSVDLAPSTEIYFSENERRELALLSGMLTVTMKVKSIDRAGLQVRTLAGLIRGPQASFTVGATPTGDTMVAVKTGVVFLGDEKKDLTKQGNMAEAAIKAANAGKETPKTSKTNSYIKVLQQQVGLINVSSEEPSLVEGETASQEVVQKFLTDAIAALDKNVSKTLGDHLKAIEAGLNKTETLLTETATLKASNMTIISKLQAARAANDAAKVTEIQGTMTRTSRLLLSRKREAHLLALEANLRFRLLSFLQATSEEGSLVKGELQKQQEKIDKLTGTYQKIAERTKGLRPRSRAILQKTNRPIPGKGLGNRGLRPNPKVRDGARITPKPRLGVETPTPKKVIPPSPQPKTP